MGQICSQDNTVGGPPFTVGNSNTNQQQYQYPNQQQLAYQMQQQQVKYQMMFGQPNQTVQTAQTIQAVPVISNMPQPATTAPQIPVIPVMAIAAKVPPIPQPAPQPVLEQKTQIITLLHPERDLIRESLQDSIYFGLKTPSLLTNQNSHIKAGNSGFHFAQQAAPTKIANIL